jgi:hypothetical protein
MLRGYSCPGIFWKENHSTHPLNSYPEYSCSKSTFRQVLCHVFLVKTYSGCSDVRSNYFGKAQNGAFTSALNYAKADDFKP